MYYLGCSTLRSCPLLWGPWSATLVAPLIRLFYFCGILFEKGEPNLHPVFMLWVFCRFIHLYCMSPVYFSFPFSCLLFRAMNLTLEKNCPQWLSQQEQIGSTHHYKREGFLPFPSHPHCSILLCIWHIFDITAICFSHAILQKSPAAPSCQFLFLQSWTILSCWETQHVHGKSASSVPLHTYREVTPKSYLYAHKFWSLL